MHIILPQAGVQRYRKKLFTRGDHQVLGSKSSV